MKDRELLRAERVCDMGHGRVDLSPRKVGGGLNIILLYFNTSFFRMSLDPLRTDNMVVAKDYWMSRRAMEEKCKGRRKFRVQQRRKEQRSQSAGPLQACCWPPGKRWLRRQLTLWDDWTIICRNKDIAFILVFNFETEMKFINEIYQVRGIFTSRMVFVRLRGIFF